MHNNDGARAVRSLIVVIRTSRERRQGKEQQEKRRMAGNRQGVSRESRLQDAVQLTCGRIQAGYNRNGGTRHWRLSLCPEIAPRSTA